MGAQPTKVHSSLNVLRGTPIEVWSKSEGRWIQAVIGAPKDVRDPPPEISAVLVLFKETVGGRTDAYKWIPSEEIHQLIRARPESKRQAGMMDSMASMSFGTQYDGSGYSKRGAAPQGQMASMGVMGSIPAERPQEQGVMASMMASVGMAPAPSVPASRCESMASMASTIDHNGSRFDCRSSFDQRAPAHMQTLDHNSSRIAPPGARYTGGNSFRIPEESPGFMASFMGSATQPQQHRLPTGQSFNNFSSQATDYGQHGQHGEQQQGGVMASLMAGMGGSVPASLMGSQNGSMASMTSMVGTVPNGQSFRCENTSPNRTPMGSFGHGKMTEPASNPMSSFMNSFNFAGTAPSTYPQHP